jgi:hypothetical protein
VTDHQNYNKALHASLGSNLAWVINVFVYIAAYVVTRGHVLLPKKADLRCITVSHFPSLEERTKKHLELLGYLNCLSPGVMASKAMKLLVTYEHVLYIDSRLMILIH